MASKLADAPEYAPKYQTKCGVTKSHAKPLIVEWPSPDRMELENKVRQGLVVVRYVGCEMSVLDRCSVAAKYIYQGATRNQDRLEMKDEDDLYAQLFARRGARRVVRVRLATWLGRATSSKPKALASASRARRACSRGSGATPRRVTWLRRAVARRPSDRCVWRSMGDGRRERGDLAGRNRRRAPSRARPGRCPLRPRPRSRAAGRPGRRHRCYPCGPPRRPVHARHHRRGRRPRPARRGRVGSRDWGSLVRLDRRRPHVSAASGLHQD